MFRTGIFRYAAPTSSVHPCLPLPSHASFHSVSVGLIIGNVISTNPSAWLTLLPLVFPIKLVFAFKCFHRRYCNLINLLKSSCPLSLRLPVESHVCVWDKKLLRCHGFWASAKASRHSRNVQTFLCAVLTSLSSTQLTMTCLTKRTRRDWKPRHEKYVHYL